MYKKNIVTGILLLIALNGLCAATEDRLPTRRFGIFIGANNGGRDRIMLRYAVNDARSISRVFTGMGGIAAEDNIILVDPTIAEINRQFDHFGRISAQAKRNSQRTELVFYYSGHSDENGIFLNREQYGYRELRDRINAVQTDMRIVILDSCSSGAMTRAKGGVKTQPFLFDSSVSAEGYAILTSSSADEVSMESDSIESSYFTHSLLAGLRGAADSVGDGRVTLLELYRFAYSSTLAMTETSIHGTQHPSYDMQISGSGDVVLTDIKETSASLLISEDLTGRISIRDSADFLIAELTKINRKPLELGLEPGLYRITLQQENNFYRAEIRLSEYRRVMLGFRDFQMIAAASGGRTRGDTLAEDSDGEDDKDNVPFYPFNLQFLPGFNITGNGWKKSTNNVLIGVWVGKGHHIKGIGVASIGLIHTGYVHGVQASGIFNVAEGNISGIQAAGIFNKLSSDIRGVQAAGYFNIANNKVDGIQGAGIFNIAGEGINGIQAASIYNIAGKSVSGIQAAGIFNIAGKSVSGIQAASIFNIAGNGITGIQAAGIFNIAGEGVTNAQAGGIFNAAAHIEGMQAGLINVNKGGNGAMFGLINVSESEGMVPFGIINIMKNGILHPGIYVDDMLFTNFSFRSGSKHFYSLFSIGVKADNLANDNDNFFVNRAGFGFEIPIKKLFLNIDITSGNILNLNNSGYYRHEPDENGNYNYDIAIFNTSIHQVRFVVGYRIFKHLGIFAGISYDYLFRSLHRSTEYYFAVDPIVGGTFGRHTHKLGFFGGVQF